MSLSPGKLRHMDALSNKAGVIAAAAMDQRGSLAKSLATAKGVSQKEIAARMGCTQGRVSKLERCQDAQLSLGDLAKLTGRGQRHDGSQDEQQHAEPMREGPL